MGSHTSSAAQGLFRQSDGRLCEDLFVQNNFCLLFIHQGDEQSQSIRKLLEQMGYVRMLDAGRHSIPALDKGKRKCILIDDACLDTDLVCYVREAGWPVIGLTKSMPIAAAVRAMRAGACDILCHPIDLGLLRAALRRASSESSKYANLAKLSKREMDVLRLLIEGHSNKVIGNYLKISSRTVEVYRARVMDKMAVVNYAELVVATLHTPVGAALSTDAP